MPLDVRDYQGIYRLTPALNERYGKLDILVGNAAIAGVPSPLDHIEPKAWNDMIAINVTANWHLIRASDPLLKRSDAGRAVFVSSGVATSAYAYWAPYSVSKAALDVLARTYAAETSSTAVRVNLFNPGPTRTGMRAMAMPGEDPMKLPTPAQVAAKLVDLCLPSFTETGKIYDFPSGKLQEFRRPA
jgi:NAD(P)-dependent dehydrogenase (short-subunit alcohol dehydrogenase family)